MTKTHNVLIAGVGGQGAILASNILSTAALIAGYDIKKSEIHGMSQRGGSVFSHIRFGEKVNSAVIPRGEVDVFLALEEMESLRWIEYLHKNTKIVLSSTRILPTLVEEYPEEITETLQKHFNDCRSVNAAELTEKTGHLKYLNVALIGTIASSLEISDEAWKKAIEEEVPAGTFDANWNAFQVGRNTK